MQSQLFKAGEPVKKQGLIISKAGKKTLTKNQQAFNKLTQKIEKLRRDIAKKELQFDTALKIYGNEFHPVENSLNEHREQMIIVLWNIYNSKKLSKPDQRSLKVILKTQLRELFSEMRKEPAEELKKIFTALEGESYESLVQREKEMMKAQVEEMFDEMDMEIDLAGVDLDDEKAMMEKMEEIRQKLIEKEEQEHEKFQQQKQKKKKTARQVESELVQKAVAEMKQKNISTIYKQLAKLFHPDLELDEERRAEKEVLMKELTAAYEAKNLHTLLTLELKWIHKENDHLENLGEEKLAIYLQILREQVRELEQEIYGMFQQPGYQVLLKQFGPSIQRYPVETVKEQIQELKIIDDSLKKDLVYFQSPYALRYVKDMLSELKTMQRQSAKIEEAVFMQMRF